MGKLPIETPSLFGENLYPTAKEIMERQQDAPWTAQEIPVDKDTNDYRKGLDETRLNAVTIILQSFVEIEQAVGDVWSEMASWYPHSEIEGLCKEIARMETSVHAFFYQKMSDTLNIPPETIKKNQEDTKVIREKLAFLKKITKDISKDKLLTKATLALTEQVLLFSNFTILRSFKSNGHKYIMNTLFGVDYVIRDEEIHGVAATYLHNTRLKEMQIADPKFDLDKHHKNVLKLVKEVIGHEDDMIDFIFPGTSPINGITGAQIKVFIRSRANNVLNDLGFDSLYEIDENPIADWFYKGTKSIRIHDFFVSGTTQYSRKWDFDAFSALSFITGKPNE
jgi:ribonucleoside-diphosphate reductase beta chain